VTDGNRLLGTTYMGAIAIDTLGAVAPWQQGGASLPKPARLAGTWTLWFLLGLIASAGERAANLAGRFSVLVLASMIVVGPYGNSVVSAMGKLSRLFTPAATPGAA
jgi:hypothetical protein